VRVRLVANVPHQAVMGRVEDKVQCDGEFHGTKVGRQVSPGTRHSLEQKVAQLEGQRLKLRSAQPPQGRRKIDRLKQRVVWCGAGPACRVHPTILAAAGKVTAASARKALCGIGQNPSCRQRSNARVQ